MLKRLLIIVISITSPLFAFAQQTPVDQGQKKLLTAYTRMLGGYYMNEKCQYLNTADTVAYQQGIQVVNDAIIKAMQDPKTIQAVNLTVKQQAVTNKTGICNDENREIVEALYSYTTQLAYQLIVQPNENVKK